MINYKLIILFLAGVATLAWACKPTATPDQSVEKIATAVNAGNYDEAQKIAEELMTRRDSGLDTMRIERLCQLAVAMVRLGDHAERAGEYSAFALRCYQQAMTRNSQATEAYVGELAPEDFREISLLKELLTRVDARESGVVYSVDEEGDDVIHEHTGADK